MNEETNAEKDRQTVAERLAATPYCAMSTCSENDEINSRFMLFANNNPLDTFFLLTNGKTEKVAELERRPGATLSILTPAEDIRDYRETIVKGDVSILREFETPTVQLALELLARKLPMVRGMIDSGGLGDYVVLECTVSELKHRIYGEILQQVPASIITFR